MNTRDTLRALLDGCTLTNGEVRINLVQDGQVDNQRVNCRRFIELLFNQMWEVAHQGRPPGHYWIEDCMGERCVYYFDGADWRPYKGSTDVVLFFDAGNGMPKVKERVQ